MITLIMQDMPLIIISKYDHCSNTKYSTYRHMYFPGAKKNFSHMFKVNRSRDYLTQVENPPSDFPGIFTLQYRARLGSLEHVVLYMLIDTVANNPLFQCLVCLATTRIGWGCTFYLRKKNLYTCEVLKYSSRDLGYMSTL